MRVAGGEARGRRLKGAASPGVRPTTERVRAAVFNILSVSQYRERRVLDLFAGSGSLGIEALSRGALWADFVERDRRQCVVIRDNLATLGFDSLADVRQSDATKSLPVLPAAMGWFSWIRPIVWAPSTRFSSPSPANPASWSPMRWWWRATLGGRSCMPHTVA